MSLGGSGVSIGGVRILRAVEKGSFFAKEIILGPGTFSFYMP